MTARVVGRLPNPLVRPGVASLDGRIYIIGGSDPDFSRQVGIFAFDPNTGALRNLEVRNFLWW